MKKSAIAAIGAGAAGAYLGACWYTFYESVWAKPKPLPEFITKLFDENETKEPDGFENARYKAISRLRDMPLKHYEMKAANGMNLSGEILEPEKSNGRLMILSHGFRSSGVREFCFMWKYFYDRGYIIVLPNHRGAGISDGKFAGYGTFESDDLFLLVKNVEKKYPGVEKIGLLGVSLGAATVLMMSDRIEDPKIKCIVSDCSYTSEWDEFYYQISHNTPLNPSPVLYTCDNLFSKPICGYSIKDASPVEHVKNSKRPVLFIHGQADSFVPVQMADRLYASCAGEKYLTKIEGAPHARSYFVNPKKYEKALDLFLEKYMA